MLINSYRNLLNNVSSYVRITISGLSATTRKLSASSAQNNIMEERKMNINGVNINYLKVGTGEHTVLLLPGAAGSIWTDFKPQVEGLDRTKFTVVAWDPPGYGKSRPPDRAFTDDFLLRDAKWAHNLMKHLGYTKFSLIGWSDGGISSLMFASMFPDSVRKMVLVGANSYITPEEVDIYKKFKNIDSWSEKMRAPMIAVYGEDYFRKIWSDWVDAILKIYERQNGDLCNQCLANIRCPTLIVHGKKDAMVASEHPVYLKNHIVGSRLEYFENGAHNLHLRYPEKFNELVTRFLTE